jgi:glycosyltransferase involved in cell wall biosynthesis
LTKELILITAGYPYGNSETFLETEIIYLSKAYEKVKIVAVNPETSVCREIPENCELYNYSVDSSSLSKLLSLRFLFYSDVLKEFSSLKKYYGLKLSRTIFNTVVVSYKNARLISRCLAKHIDPKKDQVFYSYWSDDSAIALCLLQDKHQRINTVARCHGWDVYFHVHPTNYLPFRRLIGEQMTLIAPISSKGKQYIGEKWCIGENLEKVEVQRLGVHSGTEVAVQEGESSFHLVSCSNLIPLKRVHLIVEALSMIQDIPIRWTHFGDGILLNETIGLAERLLNDNVKYEFKGRASNKDVLAFYGAHKPSLFVNVSTSEGIPVSIMEAMSFGTPVFATDVGGTSEIVDNENGLLLPVDVTPLDLSNHIRNFIASSEMQKNEMRNSAFNTWKNDFNAETNYVKFAQKLKRFLD